MGTNVSRKTLVKNAIANVASGTSAAFLAVVLPPVLLKYLSKDIYSVWALILQVGAYTGLLNFGVQVAVGRFVAHYETTKDPERLDAIISAAWIGLVLAGLIGTLAMIVASASFPTLFPQIPTFLREEARSAMAWVGISMAVGLPFSVFMGEFIGRQRYEIPAFIQVGSRLCTAFALLWMAVHHGRLVSMAQAFACINLLTYAVQYSFHRFWPGGRRIHPRRATRSATQELTTFCLSLTVWNVAMLMVGGLDLVIVGRLDYKSVAAFAIATSLVTFMAGLQNAVFNVLIPAGAVLGAEDDGARLKTMLVNATRYGVLLLLATSIPLLLGGGFFLKYYLGSNWVGSTLPLLQLLVIGNMIRLIATPYAALLIGTGQQRYVLATPFIEGLTNLVASITLAFYIGAAGVAIGTIIGAIVGLFCHIFYNLPRTKNICPNLSWFLCSGILLPLCPGLPWFAWWIIVNKSWVSADLLRPLLTICLFLSLLITAFIIISARKSAARLHGEFG